MQHERTGDCLFGVSGDRDRRRSPAFVVVGCCFAAALIASCSPGHALTSAAKSQSTRTDDPSAVLTPGPSTTTSSRSAAREPLRSQRRAAPRPCRAGQLRLQLLDESEGGGSFGPLFSARTSRKSCTLTGYPALVLIGCRTNRERCPHPHRLRAIRFKRGEVGFYRNPRPGRVIVNAKRSAQFALLLTLGGFDATPDFVTGVSLRLGSRLTRPLPMTMVFSGPKHERRSVGVTAWGRTLRRR